MLALAVAATFLWSMPNGGSAQRAPPTSPLYSVLTQLPRQVPPGACRAALQQYVYSLDRGIPWALKLYDSSVKYPDGVLESNGYSLGHFDQCLSVRHEAFAGKYCLVKIHYTLNNSSVAKASARFHISRHDAHAAICLPSVCPAVEVETALQQLVLSRSRSIVPPLLHQHQLSVTLTEQHCSLLKPAQPARLWDFGFWFRYAAALWLLVTVYVTWCGASGSVAACFSISRHWGRLLEAPNVSSHIACIHGLRVVAVCIVVMGHRAEAMAGSPLHNPDYIEKMFESPFNVFVLNGTVVVDIFFTIGGFLLCWRMIQALEHGVNLTTWQIFAYRYFRLTPAYLVAMLLQGWLVDGLGSGPLWGLRVAREAGYCQQHWWANLLYINNYYKSHQMCIDPSWYLACDMQLLILAPLVVRPLLTWRKYRLVPFLLAFTVAFWVPYFVTFSNGLDPTVIPDLATLVRTADDKTNQLLYITTYCRAGPYLVGIAAAYILHSMRQARYFPSQKLWSQLWYVALACIVGSVALGYPFFTPAKIQPHLTALYASSFRTVFAIGIAFVILDGACTNRGSWLSSVSLLPLSKVSYSVYLTHAMWIQLSYSWIRSPLHSTDLFQAGLILSDLVTCTMLGIAFHLTVERPAAELIALFIGQKLKPLRAKA